LLFATAQSPYLALLGRVMMGGGSAFAFVGCLNVISIWFPVRRFAFMAAVVETAGMAGAISGNFWLADVISKWGWQQCMLFSAIFSGILSIFLFLIVRDAPRKKNKAAVKKNSTALWQGLKLLLHKPVVWINGVYSGLAFSVVTTFTALWAIPFLEVSHHIHLLQASMVDAVLYIGIAVGGPILGWLDSRTYWRRTIMIVNALLAALCLFAVIFLPNLSLVAVAVLLFFAGVGASGYVLTFAIANGIATDNNRGTCIGFTNMLCVVFAPILQPLVGFLVTWMNHRDGLSDVLSQSIPHFEWAMSVIPCLMVLAAGLAYFLPARR
jgi:MFS family permease